MVERGEAVRGGLMRNTLHLVTLEDYLALRPLTKPILDRAFAGSSPPARQLRGIDLDRLVAAGLEMMAARPRTAAELGRGLAEIWPDEEPEFLARGLRFLMPVVQTPPRGVWGRTGEARWQTVGQLTGHEPLEAGDAEALIRRYLRAFGPASVRDMAAWSGLNRVRETIEPMRGELRRFRGEDGRELLDVPRAPLPPAGLPAPPRFLPEFDNVLVAYADRDRVFHARDRDRVIGGLGRRFVLVDGFVAGEWRLERERRAARLTVEPFARAGSEVRAGLEREGERLLAFLASDVDRRSVEVRPPS
jgi:hypothetical protein